MFYTKYISMIQTRRLYSYYLVRHCIAPDGTINYELYLCCGGVDGMITFFNDFTPFHWNISRSWRHMCACVCVCVWVEEVRVVIERAVKIYLPLPRYLHHHRTQGSGFICLKKWLTGSRPLDTMMVDDAAATGKYKKKIQTTINNLFCRWKCCLRKWNETFFINEGHYN